MVQLHAKDAGNELRAAGIQANKRPAAGTPGILHAGHANARNGSVKTLNEHLITSTTSPSLNPTS